MTNPFLQIVVTIWINAHAHGVGHTLPKIYFDDEECEARISELVKRLKHGRKDRKVTFTCAPTEKRNI